MNNTINHDLIDEPKEERWIETEDHGKSNNQLHKNTNITENSITIQNHGEQDNPDIDDHDDDDDTDSINNDFQNLFQDPDPYDIFHFSFQIKNHLDTTTDSEKNNSNHHHEKDDSTIQKELTIDQQQKYTDINIRLKGIKAENGQLLRSTGLTLWRASTILCNYLSQNIHLILNSDCVLELGSGLGLCGILAHKIVEKFQANRNNSSDNKRTLVVMTDGDTDTLAEMRYNVDWNLQYDDSSNDDSNYNIVENTELNHHRPSKDILPCRQLLWGNNINEFKKRWITQNEKGDSASDGFDLIMGSDIIYVEDIIEPLFQTVTSLLSTTSSNALFILAYARRNVKIDLVLSCAEKYGLAYDEPSDAEGVYTFKWKV